MDNLIIGVDFDGTIVEHKFPMIGPPVPWAIPTLQELVNNGHHLVLWTIRSGPSLDEAVDYVKKHGIEIWGVNKNPGQWRWSKSPKAYCNLYIDDAALGCPLIYHHDEEGRRPYVDWGSVRARLIARGAL